MKKALKLSSVQNLKNVFIVTMILIILAVAMNIWDTSHDSALSSYNRGELILNSNRFITASDYLTDSIRAYVTTGDPDYKAGYFDEVENQKNREIAIENMEAIGITAEESAAILRMQQLSNELVPLETAAMTTIESGDWEQAIEMVYGNGYQVVKSEIVDLENQFTEMLNQRTTAESEALQQKLTILEIVLLSLLGGLIVIQLFTEHMMRKIVIIPIAQCTDVIIGISEGRLNQDFDRPSDTSEIGMLSHSTKEILKSLSTIIRDLDYSFDQIANGNFDIDVNISEGYYIGDYKSISDSKKRIVEGLSATLHQINSASTQVSAGSEQMAMGAVSLAEGATNQSISIQELATTINDISQEISTTAEGSRHAKTATVEAVKALEIGNEQMSRMMGAMELINEKSDEIRKIIKTIDDIAFQTNILSLNAAVEAARAGNAGKGFAVVADEVRNLATKSAQSAKDTANLIEETLLAVNEGNSIARETAKSIGIVTDKTKEVNSYMDEISQSSSEQSQSVSAINSNIEEISAIVNQNSATSEESAAACEELSVQAQLLKSLVSQFNLKNVKAKEGINYRDNKPKLTVDRLQLDHGDKY